MFQAVTCCSLAPQVIYMCACKEHLHILAADVLASATTNASSCSQLLLCPSFGPAWRVLGCPMASQVLLGRFAWTLRHSSTTGTPLILEKSCARLMTACSWPAPRSSFFLKRHIRVSISSTEPTNSWLVIGRTVWLADGSVYWANWEVANWAQRKATSEAFLQQRYFQPGLIASHDGNDD